MNSSAPKTSAYAWCLLLGGMCFLGRTTTALLTDLPLPTGTEILYWDILAIGMISAFIAPVAGIPVHRALAKFVRTVLEVLWS